jgi:PHD/YefM family antitoxin component YafN of YafNO toxin-antitoxin module
MNILKTKNMEATISIPLAEYQNLKEELELLKNTELVNKLNRLIDLMFQEKYGMYLSDFQDDIVNEEMKRIWGTAPSNWDNV